MKINKRKTSSAFLIVGMTFLLIGFATNNTAFSWVAVVFVLLSLLLGGRWLRPRRK
jgi:hypothetical protein